MSVVGKGGRKPKVWPRSWKQAATTGGTLTIKGRSFVKEYAVVALRVDAAGPSELEERLDEALALALATLKQRPS